jgi:RNA polymerase sigma factor (sigma-70 family)
VSNDTTFAGQKTGSGGSDNVGSPIFATTHWSVILSAQDKSSPGSFEALESLCKTYWQPLYGFVRRMGNPPPDAEDLTQAFFARLLEKDYLASVSQEKGRFRSFLLTALKRFLANEWDRQHAQKRGGFARIVPIDLDLAETAIAAEMNAFGTKAATQPDVLFDRQWAQALLTRTLELLRLEYFATGRAKLFEHIQCCLAGKEEALSYGEIGARLNLSEGAVKMAVFRLRSRYRELLYQEVSQTVCNPEETEDEIRHLLASF